LGLLLFLVISLSTKPSKQIVKNREILQKEGDSDRQTDRDTTGSAPNPNSTPAIIHCASWFVVLLEPKISLLPSIYLPQCFWAFFFLLFSFALIDSQWDLLMLLARPSTCVPCFLLSDFPAMALSQAASLACATAAIGILSFILGIVAENKKVIHHHHHHHHHHCCCYCCVFVCLCVY
jgi:hypothetical protein